MPEARTYGHEGQPRFVCDDNLGKLARYLRVGGHDTIFDSSIDNNRLIQVSLDEKRYILTRDRQLIERRLVRYYFYIEHDRWEHQLKAVVDRFRLVFSRSRMFTRCLEDNTPTREIAKERVKDRVWPYTYEQNDDFRECPECGRVFWSGSHVRAVLDRLGRAGIPIID
jgi:uncharacterized protein with PIN domain